MSLLRLHVLLITCLLIAGPPASAEIYKWTDEHGRSQFTDKPPTTKQVEQVKLSPLNTYDAPSQIFIDETLARPVTSPARRASVVVYSTTWCGVCTRAKNWLRANSIDFTEYDVEKSTQGKLDFKKLGARGVPVILVGKQRMNGFSAARMREMLITAGYKI